MKSKKLKKIIFATLTSISLLGFLGGNTCLASGWSSESSWGSQSEIFSPDWGNTCMYFYDGLQGGHKYVKPMARFHFGASSINYIKTAAQNGDYYTFDISIIHDNNWSLNAYDAYLYSTLPSPYFDIDDDPEPLGSGYYDETEVTCENPGQLVAGTDYRFESYFQVLNDRVYDTFSFTSQMSHFNYLMWEYNTIDYQDPPHKLRTFPWW